MFCFIEHRCAEKTLNPYGSLCAVTCAYQMASSDNMSTYEIPYNHTLQRRSNGKTHGLLPSNTNRILCFVYEVCSSKTNYTFKLV